MNTNEKYHLEKVCTLNPWNHPIHDYSVSHILRVGDRVFLSTADCLTDREGMCNVYPMLYEKRGDGEWKLVFSEESSYQMDAGQLIYQGNNRLVMTLNPPKDRYPKDYYTWLVPCTPVIYLFDIAEGVKLIDKFDIPWDRNDYPFKSHNYRSSGVDIVNGNLLCTNIHYPAEEFAYSLMDARCRPIRLGKLEFPYRVCYHNIAMRDGETYLFGVQDVIEPNEEWRNYQKQMSDFLYVFRTVHLNYSPDITKEELRPSVVICSKEETCGQIENLDCAFTRDGQMIFMAGERQFMNEIMRDHFFPGMSNFSELCFYRLSKGEVIERVVMDRTEEGDEWNLSHNGFIHTAANGELYLVWSKIAEKGDGLFKIAFYIKSVDEPNQKPYLIFEHVGVKSTHMSNRIDGSKASHGATPSDLVEIYWVEGDMDCMYACFDLKDMATESMQE